LLVAVDPPDTLAVELVVIVVLLLESHPAVALLLSHLFL
jgi:hypothetical protein